MKKKLRVGILFGGKSGEHEISLRSANSILSAIDRKKYDIVEIGITKQGRWLQADSRTRAARRRAPQTLHSNVSAQPPNSLSPTPPPPLALTWSSPSCTARSVRTAPSRACSSSPTFAYVGSGVLGSAAGMDKDAMKRLFLAAGLPITPHVTLLRNEWRADPKRCTRLIEKSLTYPVFVKPANLGSSVGISKVKTRKDLASAMDLAASFDRKLVIEQGVGGPGVKPRELEVAVLGNDTPEASVVGEIVPAKEFYDYEAKYELNGADESVSHHPRQTHRRRSKTNPHDGPRRLPCLRLRRPRPRRLPDGSRRQRQARADLPQRDQHPARLHLHQHVSQAVGGQRRLLSAASSTASSRSRLNATPKSSKRISLVHSTLVVTFPRRSSLRRCTSSENRQNSGRRSR